jgi:hypothetical protein
MSRGPYRASLSEDQVRIFEPPKDDEVAVTAPEPGKKRSRAVHVRQMKKDFFSGSDVPAGLSVDPDVLDDITEKDLYVDMDAGDYDEFKFNGAYTPAMRKSVINEMKKLTCELERRRLARGEIGRGIQATQDGAISVPNGHAHRLVTIPPFPSEKEWNGASSDDEARMCIVNPALRGPLTRNRSYEALETWIQPRLFHRDVLEGSLRDTVKMFAEDNYLFPESYAIHPSLRGKGYDMTLVARLDAKYVLYVAFCFHVVPPLPKDADTDGRVEWGDIHEDILAKMHLRFEGDYYYFDCGCCAS